MDVDRNAGLAAQPFRETDVVAVAVGQHESADVGQRSADHGELSLKVVPVPGQPGVDEGDALGQVDEIRGDDVVAEAVEVGASFMMILSGGCDGYVT